MLKLLDVICFAMHKVSQLTRNIPRTLLNILPERLLESSFKVNVF